MIGKVDATRPPPGQPYGPQAYEPLAFEGPKTSALSKIPEAYHFSCLPLNEEQRDSVGLAVFFPRAPPSLFRSLPPSTSSDLP